MYKRNSRLPLLAHTYEKAPNFGLFEFAILQGLRHVEPWILRAGGRHYLGITPRSCLGEFRALKASITHQCLSLSSTLYIGKLTTNIKLLHQYRITRDKIEFQEAQLRGLRCDSLCARSKTYIRELEQLSKQTGSYL